MRESTARAYLKPVRKRSNLTVITKADVEKIVFEDNKAVGVKYRRNNKTFTIRADKEVILSAGSIGSPTLLQLSGVGPADVLKQAGVEVVKDLPGVGENLQDHLEVYFQYYCTKPITLNSKLGWLSMGLIGVTVALL